MPDRRVSPQLAEQRQNCGTKTEYDGENEDGVWRRKCPSCRNVYLVDIAVLTKLAHQQSKEVVWNR